MSRGMFRSLAGHEGYQEAEKDWIVELSSTNCYWYDLLASPPPEVDTRKGIVQYLGALRQAVEESLEKRFIYFICTRTRLRFDTGKKPRYRAFSATLELYLLVGRENKRVRVATTLSNPFTGLPYKPVVEVSDRFISLRPEEGPPVLMSIHDFLMSFNIDIGLPTTVQYVGYTQSPESRPTNGSHTGLSDVLARVSNDDNDVFLIFNLFKVLTKAYNAANMLNFIVANAMTDEIGADLEGRIIEKCFIVYFDSANQTRARKSEIGELRNSLRSIGKNNKINSVQFVYEVDPPTEYWQLGSSKIKHRLRHVFTVRLKDSEIFIEDGASTIDGLP